MAIRLKSWATMANVGTTLVMPAYPDDLAADDFILVLLGKDGGAGTWAELGGAGDFTACPNNRATDGTILTAGFYRHAAGGDTPRSFSSGQSDQCSGYVLVLEGVHTTTPFEDTDGADFDSSDAGTWTPPAMETFTANCWNLWYAFGDGGRGMLVPDGLMGLMPPGYCGDPSSAGGGANAMLAWTVQAATGASLTPAVRQMANDTGQILCFSLKPADATDGAPRVSGTPLTMLHPLRGNDTAGPFGGAAFDPTGTVTAIAGNSNVTYDTIELKSGSGLGGLNDALGVVTSSALTNIRLGGYDIPDVDLSGQTISISIAVDGQTRLFDTIANHGFIFGLRSGTDPGPYQYKFWNCGGVNSIPPINNNHQAVVIEVDGGFEIDEIGTFDSSNVSGVVWASNRALEGATITTIVGELVQLNRVRIVGGHAGDPCTMQTFQDGLALTLAQNMPTAGQSMMPMAIGDGSTKTYFRNPNAGLEPYPALTAKNRQMQVSAGFAADLEIYATDDCYVDLSDMVLKGDGSTPLTFHPLSSALATYKVGTVPNRSVTLQDVFSNLNDAVFSQCQKITRNGATLTGSTIRASLSATGSISDIEFDSIAALNAEIASIGGGNFVNNPVALRLVYTGTANLTGTTDALPATFTASGNTADIHLDDGGYDVVLTVPVASGSGWSTTATSGGGTSSVTFVTPINFIVQNLASGNPYWCWNVTDGALVASGTGTGSDINIPFTASGKSILFRAGGDQAVRFETTFTTGAIDVPISVSLPANPFRAVDNATALAYSGISITGDTSVDYTGTRSIQHCYDYCQAWGLSAAGLPYDIPQTTADGTVILLDSTYTHDVDGGSITDETKEWSGTFTVSGGGFFEDREGAIWEAAGSNYYATHFYLNVRSNADESDIEAAVVAFVETDGDTDVTYSTLLSAGGVTTDANGDCEGYAVYKVDATTYSGFRHLAGEYGFDWFDVPVTLNGSPIGASGAETIIRLVPDAQVTLSKSAALAVTGITANHSTKVADLSDETNSAAYDNLKARQARTNVIDTGIPGYLSYYQVGLLIDYDGSFFNGLADWRYQNLGGTGIWKTGTIELDTPGVVGLDVNTVTFDYVADGTYTHSGDTLDGTITVDTSNGSTVTAAVGSGKTIVNNDEVNITVDTSENFLTTVRISVPDEYADADIADSRHRLLYVDGAAGADYNTASAVTVKDASDVDVEGDSSDVQGTPGAYYLEFDYAYDNNDQAGLDPQTDKAVVLVLAAVGRRFKELSFTITRNSLVSQTAELEEDFNAAA